MKEKNKKKAVKSKKIPAEMKRSSPFSAQIIRQGICSTTSRVSRRNAASGEEKVREKNKEKK
jgi:hypothetical protein